MTGVPGPFWPWRGASAVEGIALAVAMLVVLALIPAGWWVLKRQGGTRAAGPLWLLLAFEVLALGYALFIPPWQTPDEPQHMVHVEVVRRGGFGAAEALLPFKSPSPGLARIDAGVQRDIVDSMRATDAGRWLPGGRAALRAGVVPGPTELNHPPLYYDVAAIIVRPFGAMPVVGRLALLRVVGVVFAAGVVWCCGAAGRLVFGRRRWAEVPGALAVAVPTFVLFAGSVNNDALAQLLAALLILVLVAGVLDAGRLARPLPWLGLVVVLVVLGVLTKRTFVPLFPVVVVAMAVRLRRHARVMLAALAAVEAVVALVLLTGADARLASWQRATTTGTARCRGGHGDAWAICLTPSSYQVTQKVALVNAQELGGQTVRAAAWLRGSDATLSLDVGTDAGQVAHTEQPATPDWRSVVVTGRVPPEPGFLAVALTARGPGTVSVDDVKLGPFDPTQPGAYADPAVDVPGPNFVTNGSGESAVLGAPSALPGPVRRVLDGAVDSVDGLVRQPGAVVDSSGILTRRAAQGFGSFWGTVGWQAPAPLLPVGLQWALGVLVAAGVVGFLGSVVRGRIPLPLAAVLAAAVLSVSAAAVLQAVPPTDVEVISGRYLFPGMVAFTLVLAAGWRHLWPGSGRAYVTAARLAIPVMHAAFVAILVAPYLVNGVSGR
ncbi:MAG: hypothetical protein JO265_13255 [Acidimicrobiia bacterium]|nr:hypothetical protein [Acidimicrobiia bacterium]